MSVCSFDCCFEISILSKFDEACLCSSQGMSLCPSIMSADACSFLAASVRTIGGRSFFGSASSECAMRITAQETIHPTTNSGRSISFDVFVIQFAFDTVLAVFVPSPIFTRSFHAQRYKLRVSAYRLSVDAEPSTEIINRCPSRTAVETTQAPAAFVVPVFIPSYPSIFNNWFVFFHSILRL